MKTKDIIAHCLSICFHPRWWFKGKTLVIQSKIKGLKGNSLRMDNCSVKRSSIVFQGDGSEIALNSSDIYNCTIFLRGQGHKLIVEEGVKLHNMWIRIIGSGNTIHIGPKCTFGSGHIVSGGKGITIKTGRNCMFADGVDIWSTDTHSVFQEGKLINEPQSIIIGDHVWIGKDVAILKGVIIGNNAVVGMRSLVTKDIRPGTMNVGSPSKEIREGIDWRRSNPNNS